MSEMAVRGSKRAPKPERLVVLIAQDKSGFVPPMCEHFPGRFACQHVSTIKAARRVIAGSRRVVGAVLAPQMADGSGFDLLADLRSIDPSIPLLFVCGDCRVNSINEAHLAGVPIVAQQNCVPNIRRFAIDVQTSLACERGQLDRAMAQICHSKQLSDREQQLLAVAVHGIPRAHLALKLGLSENTVKSQVRSLLDKTEKSCLSDVVWLVHRHSEEL